MPKKEKSSYRLSSSSQSSQMLKADRRALQHAHESVSILQALLQQVKNHCQNTICTSVNLICVPFFFFIFLLVSRRRWQTQSRRSSSLWQRRAGYMALVELLFSDSFTWTRTSRVRSGHATGLSKQWGNSRGRARTVVDMTKHACGHVESKQVLVAPKET
ncbi:hypothetical protein JOL62DRAFT_589146 [Phyllosticta paracitricarpa]|uniref:Uncharacterized protein n=1 Tax=Phyllosticta paracitricarpa TaxID=2016321 RepID=A0ABR1MS37_9PEZI